MLLGQEHEHGHEQQEHEHEQEDVDVVERLTSMFLRHLFSLQYQQCPNVSLDPWILA